jgi:hypothetical protein
MNGTWPNCKLTKVEHDESGVATIGKFKFLRSPKSGSQTNSLHTTDIQFQDAATFFGVNPLPQLAIANELLTRLDADKGFEL